MNDSNEIWREFNECYSVSNLGDVRNNKTNRLLKKSISDTGYYRVSLSINGRCKTQKVHIMVGKIFVPNPDNLPVINHKNGIKIDNEVSNLEWCTQSHNLKHAFRTGLREPVINKEGKNGFSKEVKDLTNGIIYESLSQVVRLKISKYKYSTLKAMLNGQRKNKSTLIYI